MKTARKMQKVIIVSDEEIAGLIRQCIAEMENLHGHTAAYPVTIKLLESLEALKRLEAKSGN